MLGNLPSRKRQASHCLPTGRDFSAANGLARSTVRRAAAGLNKRGLLIWTVNRGTRVSQTALQVLGGLPDRRSAQSISPAEFLGAQRVSTLAIIGVVMANARMPEFARRKKCCSSAKIVASSVNFDCWDSLSHEAITVAVHKIFSSNIFSLQMRHVRRQSGA